MNILVQHTSLLGGFLHQISLVCRGHCNNSLFCSCFMYYVIIQETAFKTKILDNPSSTAHKKGCLVLGLTALRRKH